MASNSITFNLAQEQDTLTCGHILTKYLLQALNKVENRAVVIFLQGDLGAGKTTITRSIMRTLGYEGAVKSPTYTIVESYNILKQDLSATLKPLVNQDVEVFHFDLYRLMDQEELELMGIRDYFAKQALCLIEWPQKGEDILPKADIEIELKHVDLGRTIEIRSKLIALDELKLELEHKI